MLHTLLIAAYILQWFGALCNPLELNSSLCRTFMKTNYSVNCGWNDDNEFEFETKHIIVKVTPNDMLNIECHSDVEDVVQKELNFFNFSNYDYHVLILTQCADINDLNPNIDHLELYNIKIFNLKTFTKLQELDLINVSRVENLNNLNHLERLTIQNMHLSNLTIKFDRLHTLTLKLNDLADDLNQVQLRNLKNLHLLSNRNLRLVNIEQFPNLIKLEITGRYTTSESYDINKMKLNPKLEFLEISYYELDEIKHEQLFTGLKHLHTIFLNNNGIPHIRSNRIFNDLPNLIKLDLSANNLTNIRFLEGTRLPKLRVLNLNNNRIKALVKGIHTLTALEELHLNQNGLIRIDDEFFSTKNKHLNTIYLQGNLLKFASNSVNNPFVPIAESLVSLNLKNNCLQNFNEMYAFKFHSLTNLDVSQNNIRDILGSQLKFNHAINVNFDANNITEIRFEPDTNCSLVKLSFRHNDHFNLSNCRNYEFIKYFDNNRALVHFPTLDNINLTHYYCLENTNTGMCASDQCLCKKFPYTKTYQMNCANKNLSKLPDELPEFPESTFAIDLVLDNNNFAAESNFVLPAVYYTKIARLSLRNCSLTNFPAFPLHNNRINELYLDDNRIPGFNYSVVNNFTNLVNLTLANNWFECNCETGYLYNILRERKFFNLTSLICANRNNTNFVYNENMIVCQKIDTAILTTLIVTLLLVIILATIIILKLKFALELKLLIFVFKSRYFGAAATIKYPYDLFLAYSDDDTNFVEKKILSKLESETKSPHNHIVTINRDSKMDKMVNEQIVHFVDNSKFVMIVLSKNFLNSDWNRFTFRTAYCNAFQNNRYPVIIVLKDDIKDLKSVDPTLRSYLLTRTYIRYNSRFFWSRINYILSK